MLPGRRLVVLVRRAAAGSSTKIPFDPQPQAHAACYFSTSAARAPDSSESYLVASWGLSPAAAAAFVASSGIRTVSTAKADAVLALLRRYGFSDSQIALLIRFTPRILLLDADKTLGPKLEFFASLGYDAGWLARRNILDRSLNKHIIPYLDFLRGILGTDANIHRAASRDPYALSCDLGKSMQALHALRRHGLSEVVISKLVLTNIAVLGLAPDRIAGIFEDLHTIGVAISDSRFVHCFGARTHISRDTWLRKVAFYRSLGVPEGELLRAFKTQASIMLLSEDNIKKKILFLQDELKIDLRNVMQRPVVLGYSLDKCILPRCAVLSVLMREGKIERDIDLLKALLGGSEKFFKQYVLRYAGNVPDVVEAYEGKIKFEGFKDRMV